MDIVVDSQPKTRTVIEGKTHMSWYSVAQSKVLNDIDFKFGYPSGHAVSVIKLPNGKNLYVDA